MKRNAKRNAEFIRRGFPESEIKIREALRSADGIDGVSCKENSTSKADRVERKLLAEILGKDTKAPHVKKVTTLATLKEKPLQKTQSYYKQLSVAFFVLIISFVGVISSGVFGDTRIGITLRTNSSLNTGLIAHWPLDDFDSSTGSTTDIVNSNNEGMFNVGVDPKMDLVIDANDTTEDGSNSTQSTLVVTIPDYNEGDLIIVAIGFWNDNNLDRACPLGTGPEGETITTIDDDYGDVGPTNVDLERISLGYWIGAAGGHSSGDWNVTCDGTTRFGSIVTIVPSGEFDATTPISSVYGQDNSTANDTEADMPAMTAASDDGGGKLLNIVVIDQDQINTTPPTGWTLLEEEDWGRVDMNMFARDAAVTDSESISAETFDFQGTDADAWVNWAFIVRTNGNAGDPLPEKQAPGNIGQALNLDGENDWINFGNQGSGVQTISFWMRTASTTYNPIIDVDGTDLIEINSSGNVVATSFPASTVYINGGTNIQKVRKNEWMHVVVTDSTGVSATALSSATSTTYFEGRLDDVRIFDRELSQEEVTRLYEAGATTKINTTINANPDLDNGLVSHWTFDGSATDFTDYTGEFRDRIGSNDANYLPLRSTTPIASSTGSTSPTASANSGATGCTANESFTNISNVYTQNDQAAQITTTTFDSGDETTGLHIDDFGFSLPANSTIDGVMIGVEKFDLGVGDARDELIQLKDGAGSSDGIGNNKADGGTSWLNPGDDTYEIYGGPSDTWGTSISQSQVEDSEFGVYLCATAASNDTEAYVDHLEMNVFFTYNQEIGAGTSTRSGAIGQAVELDAVDDWINFGNVGTVNTIAFWMRVATDTTSMPILDIDGTDMIELNGSSNIVATSFPSATVYTNGESGSITIRKQEWVHVVVTDTTGVNASTLTTATSSGYYGGAIDDLRVYSRVLSANEIQRLYELGATTKINKTIPNDNVDEGMTHYWTFDGGDIDSSASKPIRDRIGSAHATNLITSNSTASTSAGSARSVDQGGSDPCDDQAWSTPSNVTSSDNLYSTATGGTFNYSEYLHAYNFGFSIPTGVSIDGVIVEVERKGNYSSNMTDYDVRLCESSSCTLLGTNNENADDDWPTSDTYTVFGSAVDTWGVPSLSPAQVNDTDFGFANCALYNAGLFPQFDIDHVRMRVFYSTNPAVYVPGKLGQGILFDGVENSIGFGNIGSFNSIAFWMKTSSTTGNQIIEIDGTDKIELNSSGNVVATSFPAATVYTNGSSATKKVRSGEWTHIVITDSTGVTGSNFGTASSTTYYDGILDDVRTYNKVLTQDEITRLYELGK